MANTHTYTNTHTERETHSILARVESNQNSGSSFVLTLLRSVKKCQPKMTRLFSFFFFFFLVGSLKIHAARKRGGKICCACSSIKVVVRLHSSPQHFLLFFLAVFFSRFSLLPSGQICKYCKHFWSVFNAIAIDFCLVSRSIAVLCHRIGT